MVLGLGRRVLSLGWMVDGSGFGVVSLGFDLCLGFGF